MKKTIEISYDELTISDLTSADSVLIAKAIQALTGSYSPYSHYCVGAAVRLGNGEILCGSNQENASYPCGTCAERSALNYAQSLFPGVSVDAIAIVARKSDRDNLDDNVSPCGLCRQVLAETELRQNSPVRVILAGAEKANVFYSAKSLLPLLFEF